MPLSESRLEIELGFGCMCIRYEGQRDQLYSQTFNLEQVSFATEGIRDAQQTVRYFLYSFGISFFLSILNFDLP
jgi:hypothetical protein